MGNVTDLTCRTCHAPAAAPSSHLWGRAVRALAPLAGGSSARSPGEPGRPAPSALLGGGTVTLRPPHPQTTGRRSGPVGPLEQSYPRKMPGSAPGHWTLWGLVGPATVVATEREGSKEVQGSQRCQEGTRRSCPRGKVSRPVGPTWSPWPLLSPCPPPLPLIVTPQSPALLATHPHDQPQLLLCGQQHQDVPELHGHRAVPGCPQDGLPPGSPAGDNRRGRWGRAVRPRPAGHLEVWGHLSGHLSGPPLRPPQLGVPQTHPAVGSPRSGPGELLAWGGWRGGGQAAARPTLGPGLGLGQAGTELGDRNANKQCQAGGPPACRWVTPSQKGHLPLPGDQGKGPHRSPGHGCQDQGPC